MSPIRREILAAVVAGLTAVSLAACSDEDDGPSASAGPAPPLSPTSQESSKLRAPTPLQPPPGNLERFPDGAVRYSGKTVDGEDFFAQLGGDVVVPESVTVQIPIYPGAVPFSVMEAGSNVMVTLDSTDGAAKIYDFYTQQLPAAGWNVEDDLNVAGQRVVTAVRNGRKIVLQIDGTKDGSRIAIAVTDAG